MIPKPAKRGRKPRKPVRRVRRTRPGVPSEKTLDDLARDLCRSRGVCEAAGWKQSACKGVIQWAHVISRQYRRNNLRWRMDNCLALCAGHHFRWTKKNEAEWSEFKRFKFGVDHLIGLEREALYGEKADKHAALAYLLGLKAMRDNAL